MKTKTIPAMVGTDTKPALGGGTLRRGSAIMRTVWSDLEHQSRCTRTEHFPGIHAQVVAKQIHSRSDEDDPAQVRQPAKHNLSCARLLRSAGSVDSGYAAGGARA